MNFIRLVIQQPVTVAVGVALIIMAGLVALQHIPIQLTPNVEDTIISVQTFWEGASPDEIEREIIEKQEDKLQGLANLRAMTSTSQQSSGSIVLEFELGVDKDVALREVSDKLRQVPDYPDNVDEPVVEASNPRNRDYIAWIIFSTTDDSLDIRTLQDFAEDAIEPLLERVNGVSEINVLGGRERELQIRFDPVRLAEYSITPRELVSAIQGTNRNISAGQVPDSKVNVRIRTVSQYESTEEVESTVITFTEAGPVFVRDVADVVLTYKEVRSFVRSKGRSVIAINAQREIGTNVMEVMAGLKAAIARLNAAGGVLETEARRRNLDGNLSIDIVYDQTGYIKDAISLVQSNIWIGGGLAIFILIIFLRSWRTVGIIALAIPISMIGAIVVMVALGRTVNVISLAGMAFAVGMVVDNAIVVLENIYRHIEMGKSPREAAYDGTREVWGAVLASTLTTVFVFVPILLIQEEAGQLFRDISLAIVAAVSLSLLVSITVIPTAAARLMKPIDVDARKAKRPVNPSSLATSRAGRISRRLRSIMRSAFDVPELLGRIVYALCGSWIARIAIVALLTAVSVYGTIKLMPPTDYLPSGNRNLIFGMLFPPPGYNLDHQQRLAERAESTIRPYWEVVEQNEKGSDAYADAAAALPEVATFDWMLQAPGPPITPPPIENYFFVGFEGMMFHGAVSADPARAVDLPPLFAHATRAEMMPGVMGFAIQTPLFQLGGSTGSAIRVDLTSDNLAEVTAAAQAAFMTLAQKFGFASVQPSPSNFNLYGPEIRVIPRLRALADLGLSAADLGLAVAANGDGAIVGEYRSGGTSIDLRLIANDAVDRTNISNLGDIPIATPTGNVVPLSVVAEFVRGTSPPQINHVNRQRSVTIDVTPGDMAIDEAVAEIEAVLTSLRDSGAIPQSVGVQYAGSASKLASVKQALLGDGTFIGTLNSSLVMALLVVYLLLCVLFQSFLRPIVIMFSVPLAMLGGFAGLFAVFIWSANDRYLPIQKLDVLTMLGFVILIGVVVNNAILIVHQAQNFMEGRGDTRDSRGERMPARRAIAEAVRTRVRPIFISMLTSLGGMLPLVLMPGSGSELYRGLGSVVVGGLLVSTVFTLLLVPLLFSLVVDAQTALSRMLHPEQHGTATTSAIPSSRTGAQTSSTSAPPIAE
ncbi:MAG: efflux RND transporter permease subunit [Phycisphaerales bacterium]